MSKVLLAAASEKAKETLSATLNLENSIKVTVVGSSVDLYKKITEDQYDIVIIVTPLKDDDGVNLAISIAETTFSSVIIIVSAEAAEKTAALVERYGVLVIENPIEKRTLLASVKAISVARQPFAALARKNQELVQEKHLLEDKIDEIKLINRAKQVLIKNLNISEQQAHRYIEKQAMDLRLSKKKIAQNLLKTYNNG